MLTGLGVTEALSQAKIDYVNVMLLLPNANQEVVWLDITVKEVTRMYEFNSLKLYGKMRMMPNYEGITPNPYESSN